MKRTREVLMFLFKKEKSSFILEKYETRPNASGCGGFIEMNARSADGSHFYHHRDNKFYV